MSSAFADLQRSIRKQQSSGPLRYPKKLKLEVIAAAEARRADGHSWTAISEELGMTYETLRRWSAAARATTTRADKPVAMRRVEIAERSGALTLVAPSGIRVEGASVEQIVALIRALG